MEKWKAKTSSDHFWSLIRIWFLFLDAFVILFFNKKPTSIVTFSIERKIFVTNSTSAISNKIGKMCVCGEGGVNACTYKFTIAQGG